MGFDGLRRRLRPLSTAVTLLAAGPASAQVEVPATMSAVPFEVRYAAEAVDAILTSEPATVSLEAFAHDTVTGVYLRGKLGEVPESIAYGRDPGLRRYLWFSIQHGEHLEYVAMLFDVDSDMLPEYLLFRTIDRKRNVEHATEYRAPRAADEVFDISFQSACRPPSCDPAHWTIAPRTTVAVPREWFEVWRSRFGVAAARGEWWLGRPKRVFEEPYAETQAP